MKMSDITDLIETAPAHDGYPPTGAKLPYVINRPMIIDVDVLAMCGDSIDWDYQFGLYCCGGSVEASFNLATAVMGELQGARVGGTTLSTSLGYVGAEVEGHYETQVTVQ